MSIYGVCDINISFRNLRNIDLYHQGVYYLRTQVYIPGATSNKTKSTIPNATRGSRDTVRKALKKSVLKNISEGKEEDDDTRKLRNPQPETQPMQIAVPHRFLSKPTSLLSRARGNPVAGSDFLMSPATINDREQCFCSRRILVRYIEEEFVLNDSCVFRLEIPLEHNLDDQIVQRSFEQQNPIVTVDLMWVDVEENSNGEVIGMEGSFISVARSVIELHHPEEGICSYSPILFDDTHFVQIDMLIHSCMHTLKFLPRSASQVVRAVAAASISNDLDGTIQSIAREANGNETKTNAATNTTTMPTTRTTTTTTTTTTTPPTLPTTTPSTTSTTNTSSQNRSFSSSSSLSESSATTLAQVLFPPPASLPTARQRDYFSTPSDRHVVQADTFHRVYLDYMLKRHAKLHTYMKSKVQVWLKSIQSSSNAINNLLSPSELEDKMTVLLSVLNDENMISQGIFQSSISSRAQSTSPNTLSSSIQYDMNCMSMETLLLYHQLIELMIDVLTPMTADLRMTWENLAVARAHESIFSERMRPNDYIIPRTSNGGQAIGTLAARQLRKDANMTKTKVRIDAEDEQLFGKRSDRPLLFATSYDAGVIQNIKPVSETEAAVSIESAIASETIVLETNERESKKQTITTSASVTTTPPASVSPSSTISAPPSSSQPIEGHCIHLIVFQHGYQGTSYDLRLFRDVMKLLLTNNVQTSFSYLIASSNERQTDGNIEMMGHRLATEVTNRINNLQQSTEQNEQDDDTRVVRLSFIGHSLGSVIIRSALTSSLLTPFLNRLWSFVSLTSPHVGFFFAPGIVNTAVWFLKRWHKSLALEQLSLSDEKEVQATFFYKLSEASAPLSNFQHVVLVGSHQDNYAPYHSARIEMTKEAMNSTESSPSSFLKSMLTNILQHIEPSKLTRVDVDFKLEGLTVDSTIGRAAHIRFLDSFQLTLNFVLGYRHLWMWEK